MKLTPRMRSCGVFAATEKSRYTLDCVRIRRISELTVEVSAVDGRRFVNFQFPDRTPPADQADGFCAYIGPATWRLLCNKNAEIDERQSTAELIVARYGGAEMRFKPETLVGDAKFPDLAGLIETSVRDSKYVTLPRVNPTMLRELAEAVADLMDGCDSPAVQVRFRPDGGGPVFVEGADRMGDGPKVQAGLMPIR